MLVDISELTVTKLWDKVVSIHPGIFVTLGEVGFSEVPGDGFHTTSNRKCVHIAHNILGGSFHFGL